MLIECPSCATQARLPDSKEGAKVRCPQCSFVYVARAGGRRGAGPRTRSTTVPIALGAGIAALLFVLIFAMRGDRPPPPLPEEPPPVVAAAPVDSVGWNSELVKLARVIHDNAYGQADLLLGQKLDLPRIWARHAAGAESDAASDAESDGGGDGGGDDGGDAAAGHRDFQDLDPSERVLFQAEVLAQLQDLHEDNLIASWRPFEGSVVEEGDEEAVVRVKVAPRDESAGLMVRWVEWRFVRRDQQWKAWSWERWISPEEQRAQRVARVRRSERLELSDGSIVYEAEPRPIPWPDEVPQEQREHIEGLIDKLVDLDRRDQFQLRAQLVEIGKHAVPPLLTRMYHMIEEGLETDEDAMRLVQVDRALYDITGFVTTWKPHEALGATKERQESGLRQWFSWYERKFRRFEGPDEGEDLLEEALAPRNEAEAREQERYRRAHEAAERDAARRRDTR